MAAVGRFGEARNYLGAFDVRVYYAHSGEKHYIGKLRGNAEQTS
jgi:hypothetical protein